MSAENLWKTLPEVKPSIISRIPCKKHLISIFDRAWNSHALYKSTYTLLYFPTNAEKLLKSHKRYAQAAFVFRNAVKFTVCVPYHTPVPGTNGVKFVVGRDNRPQKTP